MTRVCSELGRSVGLAVCVQQELELNPDNPTGKGRFVSLSQLKDTGCPASSCGSRGRLGLCAVIIAFCHSGRTLYLLLIKSSSI